MRIPSFGLSEKFPWRDKQSMQENQVTNSTERKNTCHPSEPRGHLTSLASPAMLDVIVRDSNTGARARNTDPRTHSGFGIH